MSCDAAGRADAKAAGAKRKTRTPHSDVGKKTKLDDFPAQCLIFHPTGVFGMFPGEGCLKQDYDPILGVSWKPWSLSRWHSLKPQMITAIPKSMTALLSALEKASKHEKEGT